MRSGEFREISSPDGRIRILRIIARMNMGGPAIQISGLMLNLDNDRFEQLLVTGYCEGDELDYVDAKKLDFPIMRLPGFGRSLSLLGDLKTLGKLRRVIKEFDPTLIHTHTAKAGVLGRLASLSLRRDIIRVHTFHGHLLFGYFSRAKTRLVVGVERFLARFTDALVAVGEEVRDDLLDAQIGISNQYHVIGPGVALKVLPKREKAARILQITSDVFTIGWIGRAVPIKAPHRVLEIAHECKVRGLNVNFLFAGDGPLLRSLMDAASQSDLPIKFLGWQSEIETVLAACDAVILTSLNEGTPVSLIQAQMSGKPVIASDVGSTREVLEDGQTGFCIEYSTSGFCSTISELVGNRKLVSKLGAAAKLRAQSKFSVQSMVSSYENLYLDLVNQANS